jgi:hypothetical protein
MDDYVLEKIDITIYILLNGKLHCYIFLMKYIYMCVCVCVCVREREREREIFLN